jgi:hypothetical protein
MGRQERAAVVVAVVVEVVALPQPPLGRQLHWAAEAVGVPCEQSPYGLHDAATGR